MKLECVDVDGVRIMYGGTRIIDPLGRLVVPRDIRKKLGWGVGDAVDFYGDIQTGQVIIKRHQSCEEAA